MKLAEGGISWIAAGSAITVFLAVATLFSSDILQFFLLILTLLFGIITVLLTVFFRDPERAVGTGVVSPADGIIREIRTDTDSDSGDCIVVSIFMNIHNVHVNRMPLSGEIKKITHINGSHRPAFKKESERNERVITLIHTTCGMVKLILIAGTLARRIVPYIKTGDTVKKGERIGLIRLGSRVDLYLPKAGVRVLVNEHDKVKAGEDSIAEINA